MKIERVDAIAVSLPLAKPVRMAGAEVRVAANVIVRVQTDSGLTGWGECASAPTFSGETQGSMMSAITGYLAPVLVGEDPMRREALRAAMDRRLLGNNGAKAAVEIALFDVAGQALGAPVYELLGGRARDAARCFWHLGNADPDADAREAAARRQDGFTFFKLKVGTTTVERDIEAALKVRHAVGPDCDLAADANQAWSVAEALRFVRGAEPAQLSFFEQPVPMSDLAGMAAVARAGVVPVLADEGIFTASDVLAHAQAGAARIVSVKLLKAGGFTGALRAVHAAESVHLPLHLTGKVAESGIATAALVHLAVAVRELHYGLGITNHYLKEDLVVDPLRPVAGHVRPFEGPGLGVQVDEERLRRFAS
ncbi:MAG TPA: enolase C-terminal domain-like protein [Methylomirabilota bacterium]|nr:enolase C-terminal domain-like protein [Methylomirabilota bacterium]